MLPISKKEYDEACLERHNISKRFLWAILATIVNIVMIFVSYNKVFGLFASLSIYIIIDSIIDLKNNWKVINQYLIESK